MKKIMAVLLPLLLAAMPMATVQRASASVGNYPYAEGEPFVLPAPLGKTQAVLEKAELDISIGDVYDGNGLSAETLASYATSASVKYTLFNPTEDDLTLRLVRTAALPDALEGEADDAEKYAETADGEAVVSTLRYAYEGGWGGREYTLLSDMEIPDDFYTSDLVCHTHIFDMTSENKDVILKAVLNYNPNRTHIFIGEAYSAGITEGRCELYFRQDGAMSFVSAGETPRIETCAVKESVWGSGETEVPAQIGVEAQEMHFGAYVQASRPEGVGETDWYNAAVRYLRDAENGNGLVYTEPAQLPLSRLKRLRETALTIAAGARVTAAWTGPVYPDVYRNTSYRFLFAPAWEFVGAESAEFVCTVRTDAFTDPTLPFEEREGAYVYSGPLPLGDLDFLGGETAYEADLFDVFYVAFSIAFFGLLPIAIITVIVVVLVRRHRRKKRNTQ